MSEPVRQRPLQSAGFVMLAIAATDFIIKLIEYMAGDTPLWKMMLGAGIAVLLVDLVAYDRSSVGANLRFATQWLWNGLRQGFTTIWQTIAPLFRRTPPGTNS
ncbi:hypothetical protein Spb1_14910 [Planctopirus ephydatiae]|uniref:Uncharacterized protein n=1 Tax=Planctopirus ephydatiae TaxID=2528019 RepID=A0A518GLY3_9PLAN|nr:hypothetical protein [Planctopirus ephydatiae]QDV29579.1 hypothetical protein Spb1_14910 [Planctopirus ephydatiae]